jgi:glutamate dehydrogenase
MAPSQTIGDADGSINVPSKTNGNGTAHNKNLEQVIRAPGRQPSPQPTHLSVPGNEPFSRVLSDQGSGYEAPKFEGKTKQMDE